MKKYYFTVLCLACISFAGKAQLDTAKRKKHWESDKIKIAAGIFFALNNTDIKVGNSQGNTGANIDFEKDLGFKKYTPTFLGNIQWRSSIRSRFDLSYYSLARSANYTLQKNIEFGNHTYSLNAKVESFFNTGIYRISYGYAVVSKPKWEAGVLAGVHLVNGSIGLGLVNSNISATVKDDFGFTAPLPDFGIWNSFFLNKRLVLNSELDYLSVTIGNVNGRILSYALLFNYTITNRVHFTAGYTGLNFKINATSNQLNGYLKWGYNGPSLTAVYLIGCKTRTEKQ